MHWTKIIDLARFILSLLFLSAAVGCANRQFCIGNWEISRVDNHQKLEEGNGRQFKH